MRKMMVKGGPMSSVQSTYHLVLDSKATLGAQPQLVSHLGFYTLLFVSISIFFTIHQMNSASKTVFLFVHWQFFVYHRVIVEPC